MFVTRQRFVNDFVLNESQESDSQKLAIKFLIGKGFNKDKADEFVRKTIRLIFKPLGHNAKLGKFTYGLTRMFIEYKLKFDDDIVSDINDRLPLLMNEYQSYDKNLNDLSPEEFVSKFSSEHIKKIENEKEILSKLNFNGGDYDIVKIDTFDESQRYTKFTPKTSAWCLCTDKGRFDYYSCNGRNSIYFCLKKGFQNIPEIEGEHCPFDKYGLSMLCVVVSRNSELVCCALRWNHLHGCNDNMMNAVQLSKVLNLNFYEYFKQNDTTSDKLKSLQNKLDNGERLDDIFTNIRKIKGCYICEIDSDSYIIINANNKILTKDVYANIINVEDLFIAISDNYDNYSFIDNTGKVIVSGLTYVEYSGPYSLIYDKFIFVGKEGKYNYFNVQSKKLISDIWFDKLILDDGMIKAILGNKTYVIDSNGNIKVNESILEKTYNITNMNNNILYISIDLDNESRRKLKYFCEEDVTERFGDNAVYKCHHMTISHCSRLTPEILDWCQENKGKEFTLYVDTIGFSEKAIAVGVDVDGVMSTQAYPHITVAINSAVNGKPVDSNYIKDFEDVYENVALKGKLTFHYKGEADNTTLLESYSKINEWISVDDNEDIQDYLKGYPGEDFNPDEIGSYELMQWCKRAGDFLYAYPFPIGYPSVRLRAANTDSIVEDIVNDIDACAYIEHTHEIDDLLFDREDEFRNMYVAVFKICGIPDEKDYYVVYQDER